jgi:hypothetical protein
LPRRHGDASFAEVEEGVLLALEDVCRGWKPTQADPMLALNDPPDGDPVEDLEARIAALEQTQEHAGRRRTA